MSAVAGRAARPFVDDVELVERESRTLEQRGPIVTTEAEIKGPGPEVGPVGLHVVSY